MPFLKAIQRSRLVASPTCGTCSGDGSYHPHGLSNPNKPEGENVRRSRIVLPDRSLEVRSVQFRIYFSQQSSCLWTSTHVYFILLMTKLSLGLGLWYGHETHAGCDLRSEWCYVLSLEIERQTKCQVEYLLLVQANLLQTQTFCWKLISRATIHTLNTLFARMTV